MRRGICYAYYSLEECSTAGAGADIIYTEGIIKASTSS